MLPSAAATNVTGTDLLCIGESSKNRETNNLGALWEIAFRHPQAPYRLILLPWPQDSFFPKLGEIMWRSLILLVPVLLGTLK